jgi:CheY-like chemotaxis protein
MAPPRDDCFICGKLVLRHHGVAFHEGRITDLACYLDGTATTASLPPNQRLLGVHVFIVDDNEATRDLLRAALEYAGAFVTTAMDATQGKAMLREARPHVLVSDIAMPNDGLEIVREVIRFAAETELVIPAVAISGGGDGRDHLREAGFAALLPKPFDPLVLAQVVAKLAQGRHQR